MCATRQPACACVRLGSHGTSDSSTITMSASASSAPGSKPKCIGWLDGMHTVRELCATTGIAQRSARCASSGTAAAGKALVMISGRSAPAIHSASVAIERGSG